MMLNSQVCFAVRPSTNTRDLRGFLSEAEAVAGWATMQGKGHGCRAGAPRLMVGASQRIAAHAERSPRLTLKAGHRAGCRAGYRGLQCVFAGLESPSGNGRSASLF